MLIEGEPVLGPNTLSPYFTLLVYPFFRRLKHNNMFMNDGHNTARPWSSANSVFQVQLESFQGLNTALSGWFG